MGTPDALLCTLALIILSINVHRVYLAPTIQDPRIVIIGAGPSGIAAAVKLLDYGFNDVTILEAESRIGGRIYSIPFADNIVDLGAQWCHGEKNNVVYELVKDRDLLGSTREIYKNITFNRSNGEKVPEKMKESLYELMEEIMSKRTNKSILINVSAHEFMQLELNKALEQAEYQFIDKEIAAECLASREREECSAESSDDLTVISAVGDKEYEICEGNQALTWKDKGYKAFLDLIMKTHDLGKEYGVLDGHIRLSKKVKNIHWKRDDSKVMISCEDGEEILADHVIVTVSMGVLKADHNTLFVPTLPIEKQRAIEEINFGSVSKIFLEFDKQFWPDYWTGFSLLWTNDDLESIRETENSWWKGINGYYAVDYQPRVLEVWLIGPSARYMETLNEDEVRNTCVKLLQRFLKWDIPEPKNMIRTNWFTNPNFRGTYSYHSIKTLESGVTPRDLERPLTVSVENCPKKNEDPQYQCEKPIVLFAGEASNVLHYSTVHGAVETGWREAKRLMEYYGLDEKQ